MKPPSCEAIKPTKKPSIDFLSRGKFPVENRCRIEPRIEIRLKKHARYIYATKAELRLDLILSEESHYCFKLVVSLKNLLFRFDYSC